VTVLLWCVWCGLISYLAAVAVGLRCRDRHHS
jgi:hypothetical protein